MSSLRHSFAVRLLGLLLLLGAAGPAGASPPPSPPRAAVAAPVVFAASVSWRGFVRYWKGFFYSTERVVVVVALVAVAALFIITRGKWMH